MKRFAIVAALVTAAVSPALADQRITVPAATPIELVSDSTINGMVAASSGDQLEFHVKDAVVVNGWVVIPADAKAVGHLVQGGGMEIKQKSIFQGARVDSKSVVFSLDYVTSADGGKIKLDGTNQSPPAPETGGAKFLFIKMHGTNIPTLSKGSVVSAKLDHVVHVMAKTKGSASGGYDN